MFTLSKIMELINKSDINYDIGVYGTDLIVKGLFRYSYHTEKLIKTHTYCFFTSYCNMKHNERIELIRFIENKYNITISNI